MVFDVFLHRRPERLAAGPSRAFWRSGAALPRGQMYAVDNSLQPPIAIVYHNGGARGDRVSRSIDAIIDDDTPVQS